MGKKICLLGFANEGATVLSTAVFNAYSAAVSTYPILLVYVWHSFLTYPLRTVGAISLIIPRLLPSVLDTVFPPKPLHRRKIIVPLQQKFPL